MIKSIAHICILTRDLDACERFYCGALGLNKKFDFLRNGSVFGFYVEINDHNFIEIFLENDERPLEAAKPTVMHFCLEVDDIDATINDIRIAGIEVTDKKLGSDRSWQAWLKDPNEVRIELHQYTDQSSQRLGTNCTVNW